MQGACEIKITSQLVETLNKYYYVKLSALDAHAPLVNVGYSDQQ